ncbi:MAG TPA: LysR family transcriptional regulator [Acidimicrobiales bacterium]
MARSEWLRTFVAIYRSASVTEGAAYRGLTQPAASQQLASLEQVLGAPLFVRSPAGMEPTERGRELYVRVAEPLDGLEGVLRDLDAGAVSAPEPPVRFGSSPEYFAAEVLPRLAGLDVAVTATFGDDVELFRYLERDELDVVVTGSTPPRRSIGAATLGMNRFVLVVAPNLAPSVPFDSLDHVATWCTGRPWVSYSLELPRTRRFWLHALGRPFGARLVLVAPDLRAVLRAVELGLGVSLLPEFVCRDALTGARVVELFPVSHLTPEEPWFVCTRQGATARRAVQSFLTAVRSGPVQHVEDGAE